MAEVSDLFARGGTQIRAGRGSALRAKNWRAEGLLRMLENVLEVGERPEDLIVYASLGKAARNWDEACTIAETLLELDAKETLVLQSGVAVGVMKTHEGSPMVISAVNNTVGRWSDSDRFYDRAAQGKTMWGGLTAAAWQYIGRQGVLQGTYELLRVIANRHFGGEGADHVRGRWMLTAGMGGMGSAQPISAKMLGVTSLTVEVDEAKAERLLAAGGIDLLFRDVDEAVEALLRALPGDEAQALGLVGNAAEVFEVLEARGLTPDIVTDQTAAHDPRYGYVPVEYSVGAWIEARESEPLRVEERARAAIARQVQAMLRFADRGAVVFENGNNLRVQAIEHLGPEAADRVNQIPGFMEAYLRPLFSRGIGPFRWVCLSGNIADQLIVDQLAMELFPGRPEVRTWLTLAQEFVPQQGLPARSCWLGHGERSMLAVEVNRLVANGTLSAPVLFTRDHLDSAAMTHPRIGTEGMRDDSDGVSDWPLLDAMLVASCGADLVAIHSGGGGYSGWMQSAGVSIVADGSESARDRLALVLDADSGLGVMRHAQAGYDEARTSVARGGETGTVPLAWLSNDHRRK